MKPEDVSKVDTKKVLDFLNRVKTASELAETVELPKERDIGLVIAHRILKERARIGKFTNLHQVFQIPQVGPERFSELVRCIVAIGTWPTPDHPEEEPSKQQILLTSLAELSGHFEVSSIEDARSVASLRETLISSLVHEDISAVKSSKFSFQNSDLFFTDTVAPNELKEMKELVILKTKKSRIPERRLFVREVPVRSAQIGRSVPLWANGATVEKTLGPFQSKDGRKIWFDFYKIERLVALYVQGRADPVILFKISSITTPVAKPVPKIKPLKQYTLLPGSIWIASEIFAKNVPCGSFTGLRIKGGKITLSIPPKIIDTKLTVFPNTIVTVKLDLNNTSQPDVDATSPFGIDARNASMTLPQQLSFHFSITNGIIDEIVGDLNWNVYGHKASFKWKKNPPSFDSTLNRILIPLKCSKKIFSVKKCHSPFNKLAGKAAISWSAWTLPVAQIDVTKPSPAEGIGGIAIQCIEGLTAKWSGLEGGNANLRNPHVVSNIGGLGIIDLQAGNQNINQEYKLWKDDLNKFGCSIKLQYTKAFPFYYMTFTNGNEVLGTQANANPLLDRPVTVSGNALDIHSKNSFLLLALSKAFQLIYLYDDNILFDSYDPKKPKGSLSSPIAFALHNALFKTTPVNGCLLFGELRDDMVKVDKGCLFLTFGMYAYLPTLPDPYAANLGILKTQFGRAMASISSIASTQETVWLWLISLTKWAPSSPEEDSVEVSFHLAPLKKQFQTLFITNYQNTAQPEVSSETSAASLTATVAAEVSVPDYQEIWDKYFSIYQNDVFALLDVSSNANQMGVSFGSLGSERMAMVRTFNVVANNPDSTESQFPLRADGLDVTAKGSTVRAFTLPQVSWEPVINLAKVDPGDPPVPLNYYPDDGGPTRIMNDSVKFVPIAPIPLSQFLIQTYDDESNDLTITAHFTLPFGLRSLAYLYKKKNQPQKPDIKFNEPSFQDDLQGGIQFQLNAGSGLNPNQSETFRGYTLQLNNILNPNGTKTDTSTLGHHVSVIFNNEFFLENLSKDLDNKKGVPLTRIDLSGYGESVFSNWINKEAQFASTSQAKFDVFVGRTAHEIIQVRSILYPWGIKVVRTITLYRVGSGYVYRHDSGWKAESDGKFDFRFKFIINNVENPDLANPYDIHPGVIKGLFNIQNIRSAVSDIQPFLSKMTIGHEDFPYHLDPATDKIKEFTGDDDVDVDLQPVYFDADVEIENVVQGSVLGRVPSKKILGFVQLKPRGIPLTPAAHEALLVRQFGSIGGPVDCIVDIGKSGQKMRVNWFDVNNSRNETDVSPVFVAAARGNVILPKDGSWSVVMHTQSTGEVTPLPASSTAPLIRKGKLDKFLQFPDTELLRIASPSEISRPPGKQTINFGFLQSMNTQKALFLTPAFQKQLNDQTPGKLLSKTPPLFADAYRLVSSKGIFPNIGNAIDDFGDAIKLAKDAFDEHPSLTDAGKTVLKLMDINTADGINRLKEDGYKLLKTITNFDLPSKEWYLIDEDYLKVYVEYKAKTKNASSDSFTERIGNLNYDINSFATDLKDTWKSRLNNLAMVLDLGPFKRLMIIKGNFDSKKGVEASFTGVEGDADFSAPQLEFSEELQPIIELLQILEDLQGAKYGEALKKGLKIAMSNSADSWEYKFEASKEIPVVRFPPGDLYNSSSVPLKLEASLKVGVYFNAALTTTALSDPKKLLPTAGAFMDFYGRLSVMCVTLSAAVTVYAVGQVNLRIAADTKIGPSLTMKFGFGAQVVAGLPVVGNVSLLYVVGTEIYADSSKLNISAFMLFQGNAELLGGIVGVTISIEAKGTISRTNEKTNLAAQVTFGLDISIFWVIDISFEESWQEVRQIA